MIAQRSSCWNFRRKYYKTDEEGRIVLLDFNRPHSFIKTACNFFGGLLPRKRLDMDDLIRQAQKRSGGLTDFGDENVFPFRDALEVLLGDANRSTMITPFGLLILREKVVQGLLDRLLTEELIKLHPETLDEEISAPVFVIGLPRSGTTHLQRCLAQLEELRPLKTYEAFATVVPTEVRAGVRRGVDARLKQAKTALAFVKNARPLLDLFHSIDVNAPEEHYQLCDGVLRSHSPFGIFPCKGYMKWYLEEDATVEYEYLRRSLQIIQWKDAQLGKPRRPFVLKNPMNTFNVRCMKKTFPDARIVHMHRDLVPSFVSGMYLLAYVQSLSSKLDVRETGKILLNHFENSLKKVDWTRCEDDVYHVEFQDFVKDNVKTLKGVADALNLNISERSWDKVSEYVEENSQHKHGKVHYDLEKFGITKEELKERFKCYSIYGSMLAIE